MYNLPLYNTTTKPQHGSETLEAPPSASLIQGRQPIQQKSKRLFFQALLLWTGFTVATLLLLRAIQSSFEFNDSHSPDSSSASATSSDKDPRKVISKEFVRRPEYFDFSPTGDKVWEDIIPLNGGGIPVFKPNDSLHVYGVSMFHQLHCLGMIRGAIQKLQMSQGDVAQLAESGNQVLGRSKEAENEEEMQHHWVHCLDYIMQVRSLGTITMILKRLMKYASTFVLHQLTQAGDSLLRRLNHRTTINLRGRCQRIRYCPPVPQF